MSDGAPQNRMEPRISVVCPVFNSRHYLQTTLDALFLQEQLPCELVIVDDGSSDGTPEFVQTYASKLQVPVEIILLRNEHRGPGAARNSGIARASGDWIAFLDSDDIWFPEKLAQVARSIRQNPAANFICHHEEFLRADGSRHVLAYAAAYRPELPLSPQLYRMNLFSTSAVACRRDILQRHGMFDEALMSAQDYELWLRLSPFLQVQFVEIVLGQYVERPGNITSGSVRRRLLNELRIAWRHRHLATWQGVSGRILRIFISYGKQYLRRLSQFTRKKNEGQKCKT